MELFGEWHIHSLLIPKAKYDQEVFKKLLLRLLSEIPGIGVNYRDSLISME
jgi:hypothetical protein